MRKTFKSIESTLSNELILATLIILLSSLIIHQVTYHELEDSQQELARATATNGHGSVQIEPV